MIYNAQRSRVVDYLGNKQYLAVDLRIAAGTNSEIRIQWGSGGFMRGFCSFDFPGGSPEQPM
ncbi:hypothetical protein MKY48_20780 [Paenibacillus sp. FSL W8-0187]|uniref:hypothetical protein n=1 Tax=Paenibacillus sp. FSL W8-0187 TaxID=2921710 RepID=UPI0030D7089E